MSKKQILLALILVDFAAFNAWVLWDAGLAVAFEQVFSTTWGIQVAVDLGLAIGAIMVWMYKDAKAHGANPWPWLVTTLLTGSMGWLAYLVVRPEADPARKPISGRATLAA